MTHRSPTRTASIGVLLVASVLALAACSGDVSTNDSVSASKLASSVEDELGKQNAEAAKDVDVTCPDKLKFDTGAKTTCVMHVISTDRDFDVDIRMKDEDGNFTLEVAETPN